MKFIIPLLLIALGIGGLFIAYQSQLPEAAPVIQPATETAATTSEPAVRYADIDSYVTSNISGLSPLKEQLGGTFYVTKIGSDNGTGTVEYEDGHNAYIADFTYSVAADGKPAIDSFVIRD